MGKIINEQIQNIRKKVNTMQSSRLAIVKALRVFAGMMIIGMLFMLYKDISTTGALCYHYIPFTYHLAGYCGQPWPFKITLVFPIILCVFLNMALCFSCRISYLFVKSVMIATFGLISQAIITAILQLLRFFMSIGDHNVLPSVGRIITPFLLCSEIAFKWVFCYLLYKVIKKWSAENVQEYFYTKNMKKGSIIGAGTILSFLFATVPIEKSVSGNLLFPSQVKKDKLEITFDFKRQSDWRENQFVIWMESYNGIYIKTLYVSKEAMERNADKKLFPSWSKAVETAGEKRKDLEKMTGDVPQSGKATFFWDGTDRYGNIEYEITGEMSNYRKCYIESYGVNNNHALYIGSFSIGDGTSSGFTGLHKGTDKEKTENKTIRNVKGDFTGAHYYDYEKRNIWMKKYGMFLR